MEFNAFISRCERYAAQYFAGLQTRLASGAEIVDSSGSILTPIFPTMMIVFATETHFAAELVGASPREASPLKLVKRRLPRMANYLGHFPTAAVGGGGLDLCGANGASTCAHLAVLSERDLKVLEARYPEYRWRDDSDFRFDGPDRDEEAFNAIEVSSDRLFVELCDVLSINSWQQQVRARYFQTAWIVNRRASSSELQRRLDSSGVVRGIAPGLSSAVSDKQQALVRAANFSSLAAIDEVGELTLTSFLEDSKAILLDALRGSRLIPQPRLPWLEKNGEFPDESIQPDFLLVDKEGNAHICEVKLPLLKQTSLTVGQHSRRRFSSNVADGIAQLFNYSDYFQFKSHQRFLRDRYDAGIADPRLILLIGSSENFVEDEVVQAKRMHPNFEMVDYDTLRALYLVANGCIPLSPASSA